MEKRLYERISLPIKLTYEIQARPKIITKAVSKDISGGGICIALKERLLPSTELLIKIEIEKKTDTVTLRGRVVWHRRVEIQTKDGIEVYYDTGIQLKDPDPININRIITHFYGKSF
jgi:c-di-GMP-binding flagellar brake protein YcgR